MRFIPLGTSSGVPTLRRQVSAVAVLPDEARSWFLLDCGEGAQARAMQAGLQLGRLRAVFITHLHGDHFFGLPPLLSTLALRNRNEPLEIVGPTGIVELLRSIRSGTYAHDPYAIIVREAQDWESFLLSEPSTAIQWKITTASLDHRAPAFGYRIESQQRKSEATLAYCTDTRPCRNASDLAKGVDVLIHEATYLHRLREKAHERGHSTAVDAALIARNASARYLVLTHFSPRYPDTAPLVREARAIFPSVTAARELVTYVVRRPLERPLQISAAESESPWSRLNH